MSHATVIQHFGSKEGLLAHVLAEWDRRTVAASLADADGLEYFRRLPQVMDGHRANRGLLELFTTLAAEASDPHHPAHDFVAQRYASNVTTLAGHLRQAVDAGEVAPMTEAQIETEVRLIIAVLDGVGLQWLLDSEISLTDLVGSLVEGMLERLTRKA